jgi:hypothetical protein
MDGLKTTIKSPCEMKLLVLNLKIDVSKVYLAGDYVPLGYDMRRNTHTENWSRYFQSQPITYDT